MVHNDVAKLACKAVATVYNLAIDNNAAADTGSQRNHDKVLHATRHAIGHLAHCSSVGIVRYAHGNAQGLLEKRCYGNDALPYQVGSIFDIARIIIGVGSTDTHTADIFYAAHYVERRLQSLGSSLYIIFDARISGRFNGGLCLNGTALIDNTEDRVCSPHVEPYHIGFLRRYFHGCYDLVS